MIGHRIEFDHNPMKLEQETDGISCAGRRSMVRAMLLLLASLPCNGLSADDTAETDFVVAGQCLTLGTTEAIARAKVHLIRQVGMSGEPEFAGTAETDARGRFEFTGLQTPSELRSALVQYTLVSDAKDHAIGFQRLRPDFFDCENLGIELNPRHGTLQGRVVDPNGRPVAGAAIRAWTGARLGLGMTTSAADGSFQLGRLPIANDNIDAFNRFLYVVSCDGYADLYEVADVPSQTTFRLQRGCTLTGSVRNKDSGAGIAGVMVTATPNNSAHERKTAVTDGQGNYKLCVAEGEYHILLENTQLVAPAITDLECRAGKEQQLKPLIASPGGWLTGRIIHPRTGDPVVFNGANQRIKVNNFGPATPLPQTTGEHMASVDDDGRFRIRVADGENYPYALNTPTERDVWDTQRQEPVIVPEGGVARCFIKIKVPRTDEEKMIDAQNFVAELPEHETKRAEAIIRQLRAMNHTLDDCELWCLLIKELVDIGSDAVTLICRELDGTSKELMIRRIGFALRVIGDPRAVPALIRAIPRTLQPPMNDYGLIVGDDELLEFMKQHDIYDNVDGDRHFGLGRPNQEIFAALNKITGQHFREAELYQVHRAKDARNRYWQQKQYHAVAQQWRDWWENHYQQLGVDEAYSEVNLEPLPSPDLLSLPTGLQLTGEAQIDRSITWLTLSPISDKQGGNFFLDVDTGRMIQWPKRLTHDESPAALKQSARWAAKRGADLICLRNKDESKGPFVLCGIDTQVWEIDPLDAKNLSSHLKTGKLPEGRKVDDGLLLHLQTDTKQRFPKIGSSFLYLSREQGLGIITITDFVTQVRTMSRLLQPPKGVGDHRGIRFDWKTIVR